MVGVIALSVFALSSKYQSPSFFSTDEATIQMQGDILGEQETNTEDTHNEELGSLSVPGNFNLAKIECRDRGGAWGYFTWSPVEDATHYRLYVKNNEGKDLGAVIAEGTSFKLELYKDFDTNVSIAALKKSDGKVVADSELSEKKAIAASSIKEKCITSVKTEDMKKKDELRKKEEAYKEETKKIADMEKELEMKKMELEKRRIELEKKEVERKLKEQKELERKQLEATDESEKLENIIDDQQEFAKEELEKKINSLEKQVAENREQTNNLQKVVNKIMDFFQNLFKF